MTKTIVDKGCSLGASFFPCVLVQTQADKALSFRPLTANIAIVKLLTETARVSRKLSSTFGWTLGRTIPWRVRTGAVFRLRVVLHRPGPTRPR